MNEQLAVLRSILPAFQIEALTQNENAAIESCEDEDSSWDEIHRILLTHSEITKSIVVWASCLNERLSRRSSDFFAILTGLGRANVTDYLWIALLFERMKRLSKSDSATLLDHSILTSIIASFITDEFEELKAGLLLPAALAHDIGHLLIPVNQPRLRLLESKHGDSQWARPETDHTELGALYLEALNTPELIALCCKEHHNISENANSHSQVVATVRCADIIAEAISLENSESQSNRYLAKLKNDFLDHSFSENIPLILTHLPDWAERGLDTLSRMKTLLFDSPNYESCEE